MLCQADSGVDAQSEKARNKEAGTLAEAWKRYVAGRLAKRGKRAIADAEFLWNRHIKKRFGSIPLVDIAQQDIDDWHFDVGKRCGKVTANRAFAYLRACINWQIKRHRHLLPAGFFNPCCGVETNPETPREVILYPDEMPRLSAAINEEPDPSIRGYF